MDEYCVAVSVLNRVRSPYYPNTVADVVYGLWTIRGVLYVRPVANPVVVRRLMDNSKIKLSAYSIIGDRTDFKGQSQLPYRVVSEDPMCSPNGNFFHYHWQS